MARTMAHLVAVGTRTQSAADRKRPGAIAPSCQALDAIFAWIATAEDAQRTWARNMLLKVGGLMAIAWLLSCVLAE